MRDIYQAITDQIIAQLEAGAKPWAKSWADGQPSGLPRRANGEAYRGVNTILLWAQGRTSDTWMTFAQAKAANATVRKGEKGTPIVFFSTFEKDEQKIPFVRRYVVFNAEQIDGLDDSPPAVEVANCVLPTMGIAINHGGNTACYRPDADSISMPHQAAFRSESAYTATLAHELVHATGHKSRLDRNLPYGREELVAEIGAAFVCGHLGIAAEEREDHASYLAAWIQILKDDKRAIIKAASAAQKAADYLLTNQE